MNEKKVEEPIDISVNEELDGSATVELPEELAPQNEQEVKGNDDDHHPDDTAEVRSQKNKRKQKRDLAKAVTSEKELQLNLLKKQNEDLMARIYNIEKKTLSHDIARIEKAIEDQETRVNYAKMKMSEAMSAGDGDTYSQAQEIWLEAKNQVSNLKNLRDQTSRIAVAPPPAPSVDPRLQRHANEWMERNPWYDHNANDTDTKIAKIVDEELVSEGWDPTTKDFWDELDNRLSKRIYHRYNENIDVKPSSKGPRSVVTSSGRESINGSSNRGTFTLSPEQVKAIKDAGMWDNPKMRAKMIHRYAEYARNNQY